MSILVHSFLDRSLSFLQVTRTTIKPRMSFVFCQIPSPISKLAALERLINECIYSFVSTLEPLFLIESYSFFQVTRTAIKAWMGLEFGITFIHMKQNRSIL